MDSLELNHAVECDQQTKLYSFLLLLNSLLYIVVKYLLTLSQYYRAIFVLLAKGIMNCLGIVSLLFQHIQFLYLKNCVLLWSSKSTIIHIICSKFTGLRILFGLYLLPILVSFILFCCHLCCVWM